MPYPLRFMHVLYARAKGESLNNPKFDKITPEKATEMLSEAKGKALKAGGK